MDIDKIIDTDPGTANSCAVILENGNAKVIENAESARITPLITAYTNDGETLADQPVKRQAVANPQNTLYTMKRLIGRRFEEDMVQGDIQTMLYSIAKADSSNAWMEVKGQEMAPPQISAEVLKKMKKIAEDYLGKPVTEAVTTVPAYFSDSQRQATKNTGRITGFDVKRIINEPTAAALTYDLDRAEGDHTVIVCGLGGGTFDVSVIEIVEADDEHQLEVLATNGDTFLGGEDFDIRLIDYLVDEFKKKSGISLKSDPLVMQRLKEAAGKAKIELFSTQQTGIDLPYMIANASGPKYLSVKTPCARLESLVEDLVQRIVEPRRTVLKDAGLDTPDIHEMILVGGQTHMPLVQKTVVELLGREACKDVNPDETMAVGAAIQGVALAGDVKDALLFDVTPLTLGIETLGGVVTSLIEKNTTILIKRSQVFSTTDDSQDAVTIHVLQGEHRQAAQNKSLSKLDLADIPPASRGASRTKTTFDIDANGILHVSAKDKATGKQQSIVAKAPPGLSEDEIQQMVRDTEMSVGEDRKFEELTAARNQGDTLVHAICKMITKVGDKTTAEDKAAIKKVLSELEAAVKGNDKAGIGVRTNALLWASIPLTQRIYAEQAQQDEDTPQDEQAKAADNVVDAEFGEVKDNK